jgi:hypothetical protein
VHSVITSASGTGDCGFECCTYCGYSLRLRKTELLVEREEKKVNKNSALLPIIKAAFDLAFRKWLPIPGTNVMILKIFFRRKNWLFKVINSSS